MIGPIGLWWFWWLESQRIWLLPWAILADWEHGPHVENEHWYYPEEQWRLVN